MRHLIAGFMFVVLFSTLCFASNERIRYSEPQTGDASLATGGSTLSGVIVVTDGTNSVSMTIYDGTDSGGAQLTPTLVITTSATDRLRSLNFNPPLPIRTGIFVDITTAGTVEYTVYGF